MKEIFGERDVTSTWKNPSTFGKSLNVHASSLESLGTNKRKQNGYQMYQFGVGGGLDVETMIPHLHAVWKTRARKIHTFEFEEAPEGVTEVV